MIKEILLFSGGLIVGIAGGIIGTKVFLEKKLDKKYQDKCDDEVRKMMEKHFKDGKSKKEPDKEPDKDSLSDAGVASVAEKAVQKEQEKKNQKVNYTAFSENGVEHPDDMIVKPKKTIVEPEDEEDEVEKWDRQEEENYIKGLRDSERWSRERMNKPKIIKRENYGEDPLLEKAELYYYPDEDILAFAETKEEIFDENYHVGDCLTKYGFKTNQEKTIYVRNTYAGYDFEITKRLEKFEPIETG